MVQIEEKILDDVKKYILGSIIPSRDAQELVRMLNTAKEIEPKKEGL